MEHPDENVKIVYILLRMHQDIVFYNLKKITFNIVSSKGK